MIVCVCVCVCVCVSVVVQGTGKTYTMEGFNSAEERGIIPRAIEQIFNHISSTVSPRMRFLVRASYLQIYNEVISDLLKPERSNLVIREDKKRVCAVCLCVCVCASAKTVCECCRHDVCVSV